MTTTRIAAEVDGPEGTPFARSAEPITRSEKRQAAAAFRDLMNQYAGRFAPSLIVRHAVRRAFELGWAACARTGTAPRALADVPLPLESVQRGFEGAEMAAGPKRPGGPRVRERVLYHGSVSEYRGEILTVIARHETLSDPSGFVTVTYSLGTRIGYTRLSGELADKGARFRPVLHDVRLSSVTRSS